MKAVGEVSKAGAVRVDNDKDICHGVEIDAVEADEDEEVATHIISDGLILGFSRVYRAETLLNIASLPLGSHFLRI